jgi:hypothetical protein
MNINQKVLGGLSVISTLLKMMLIGHGKWVIYLIFGVLSMTKGLELGVPHHDIIAIVLSLLGIGSLTAEIIIMYRKENKEPAENIKTSGDLGFDQPPLLLINDGNPNLIVTNLRTEQKPIDLTTTAVVGATKETPKKKRRPRKKKPATETLGTLPLPASAKVEVTIASNETPSKPKKRRRKPAPKTEE